MHMFERPHLRRVHGVISVPMTIAEAAVASAKSDGLAPTVGVASIHSSGRIRCGRCSIVMNIRNSVTIARVG